MTREDKDGRGGGGWSGVDMLRCCGWIKMPARIVTGGGGSGGKDVPGGMTEV